MGAQALRKSAVMALLVALLPLAVGFGANRGANSVTSPAEDYRAVLVDADGGEVPVAGLNVAGEVSMTGRLGRGDLKIRLANISTVSFENQPGDFTTATVDLVDGKSVKLTIRDSMTFYGRTDTGLFQIRSRDLLSVRLDH